ncbi:unnamed protein product [Pleuronectes platessa]|uniref:G-protein coupled receptors family 1 profile domain-containing protein n=1 Tax=Pleuronectes platessa TaxID=8262 RepID=A0A9N7YWK4_PLEPL|nr:unnamed protein product [Pleuronectes platessa]
MRSLTMETRKRLSKIVLVFVGLFALCWFPNHVLYMYRSFNYNHMDLSLVHLVITLLARVLSFSSSCVNPFALYLLSESFRRHFNSSSCGCGRRGSTPEACPSRLPANSTGYCPDSAASPLINAQTEKCLMGIQGQRSKVTETKRFSFLRPRLYRSITVGFINVDMLDEVLLQVKLRVPAERTVGSVASAPHRHRGSETWVLCAQLIRRVH